MTLPIFSGVISTPTSDSARWKFITPRAGDVIVASPAKCGTTWTQMLCALLIHDAPPFPQPLSRLSPWIDWSREPIEDVAAAVNSQPWRRILKTHTPLHGLIYREDALYVVCGRDPRDALLSNFDQSTNIAGGGATRPSADRAFHDAMRLLTIDPARPNLFADFESYWQFRALPNVLFLHYEDLSSDLESEAIRLADFLSVPFLLSDSARLLAHATLSSMRENAAQYAPHAHLGHWKSNEDFFKAGRRGSWTSLLSAPNQALYVEVTRSRFDHRMMAWLEAGRAALRDPRTL